MKNKKDILGLAVIGLTLLFVFVYAWSLLAPKLGSSFSQDSYGYFLLGNNLMGNKGFTSPSARDFNVEPVWPVSSRSFPPVFPLLVGAMNWLTGYGIQSNAIVNLLVLVLFIVVLIHFFKNIVDWAWILLMFSFVLFVATNPYYREEVLAGRSIPTTMLALFGFYTCFAKSLEERPRFFGSSILAGICLAIMMHTRFDQTLFCLAAVPFSFVLYRWKGDTNLEALKKTGTMFGAFLLVSMPWMVRNTRLFGLPFASDNAVAVFSTHPSLVGICYWPAGSEPDTIWTNLALWLNQRQHYLIANFKKIMHITSFTICWIPVIPLLLWRILTNKQRSFYLYACLHILCTIFSISISPYGDPRYFSSIHLNLLVMGFMCGAAVLDLAVAPLMEKILTYVALLVMLVLPFTDASRTPIAEHLLKGQLLPGDVKSQQARYGAMKAAFSPHFQSDPVIAVHHDAEIFTYYTGYRTIYYPINLKRRTKGLAEWIAKWNVDYLVLFQPMVRSLKMKKYVLASASGRTLLDAREFLKDQRETGRRGPP